MTRGEHCVEEHHDLEDASWRNRVGHKMPERQGRFYVENIYNIQYFDFKKVIPAIIEQTIKIPIKVCL